MAYGRAGSSPAFGTPNNLKGLANYIAAPFYFAISPGQRIGKDYFLFLSKLSIKVMNCMFKISYPTSCPSAPHGIECHKLTSNSNVVVGTPTNVDGKTCRLDVFIAGEVL